MAERDAAYHAASLETEFLWALDHDELELAAHLLTEDGLADILNRGMRYSESHHASTYLLARLRDSSARHTFQNSLRVLAAESLRWMGHEGYSAAHAVLSRVYEADQCLRRDWYARYLRVGGESLSFIDRERAMDWLAEAALVGETSDQGLIARSGLSIQAIHNSRADIARDISLRALSIAQRMNSTAGQEEHLDRLGAASLQLGLLTDALDFEINALLITVRRNNRRGLCYRLRYLSDILFQLECPEESFALFVLSKSLARQANDPNVHLLWELGRRFRTTLGESAFKSILAAVHCHLRHYLAAAIEHLLHEAKNSHA